MASRGRNVKWLAALLALAHTGTVGALDPAGSPTQNAMFLPAMGPRGMNVSKGMVETPLERMIQRSTPADHPVSGPTGAAPTPAKVAPGLVHWHATLEDAKARARLTGKPVLLFLLLGNLDEAHC